MRAEAAPLLVALAATGALACVRRVETSTSTVEVEQLRREDALRVATNLPDSFVVVTPAARARDCPPALREEGRNTRLMLRRSLMIAVQDSAGVAYRPFGDYALEPAGQYGAEPGEGLRVDCGSLRGVGIVALLVRAP